MADPLVVTRRLRATASADRGRRLVNGAKRRNLDEQSEIPSKRRSEVDLASLAAGYDLLAFASDGPTSICNRNVADKKDAATDVIVCRYTKEVKDGRGADANAWSVGRSPCSNDGDRDEDDEAAAAADDGDSISSGGSSSSSSSSSGRGGGYLGRCSRSGSSTDKQLKATPGSPGSRPGRRGDRPGNVWTPIAGPMSWVQQQMSAKVNPRSILEALLPNHRVIPEGVHDVMLWKIIVNILCDQPRRQKLDYVNTIDDVVSLIRSCSNVVILTGAGVSVSCGIPDFRSRDGVYARISVDYPDLPDPQAIFDIQYFRHNPYPFFKFAKAIYPGRFTPSRSHRFIKLLEERGKLLRNYTQNIDTLEKVAGIRNVIECHGSFAAATCTACGHRAPCDAIKDDIMKQVIPRCPVCPSDAAAERGIMKPDIVFFGESLPKTFHDHIANDKDKCDLLIVIGSSLLVRPVALVPSCLPARVPQVLINREPLSNHRFDVELLGDCDIIVSELCARLGDGWWPSECGGGGSAAACTGGATPMQQLRHDELSSCCCDGPVASGGSPQPATAAAATAATAADAPPLPPSSPCAVDYSVPEAQSPQNADGGGDDAQSVMETSRSGSCCDDMSLDGGPSSPPLPAVPPVQPGPPRSRAGSNATVSMQSVNGDNGVASACSTDSPSLSDGFAGKIDLASSSSRDSGAASSSSPSHEHEERLLSDRAEEYNQSGKTRLAALRERWLERTSGGGPLSSRLSEHAYLFLPPSRYVFHGAEVYSDDDDDDDDDESEGDNGDSDCDGTTVNEDQSDEASSSSSSSSYDDDEDGRDDERKVAEEAGDCSGGRPGFFVPPEDEDAHDSFPESSSPGHSSSSSSSSSSGSPSNSLCPFDPVSNRPRDGCT